MKKTLSPKGFLTKTGQKAVSSAEGFIEAYREFLMQSEVAYLTAPIVELIDQGSLMPTSALQEIKKAVLAHVMQIDFLKAEKRLEKEQSAKSEKATKKFSARIIDGCGETCFEIKDGEREELFKYFDLPQQAERWLDLRLADGAPDWTGIIYQGEEAYDLINRVRAMGRVFAKSKPAVVRTTKSTGKLSFGVKAVQSHCYFSRG